jgi:geranylgeranyl diphosphate synthase type I
MNASHSAVESAIKARRDVVNEAIPEDLPVTRPERLYEASRYLLDAGGKRLRPTMSLLVAESLAERSADGIDYRAVPDRDGGHVDILAGALAVEVIQSFTLIHDDIMDDDDLRRGVDAVHREYDLSTAILAGDTLYSKAFEILLGTDAPPDRSVAAASQLASACTKICEGQSFDISFEDETDVTTEQYLEMVELKTAVLFGAAAAIPAMLLGAEDDVIDALYGYGIDVGRAFQVQDDLLDLTTPSEQLGKQRGSDLLEDKQTIVTLHARQQGVDVDGLLAEETVETVTEADVDAAVEQLEAAGSLEFARDTAADLVASGRDHLEVLPDNEARDLLAGIADYLVERDY